MKKILLAAALLSALTVIANAEENTASPSTVAHKVHTMQNSNPSSPVSEQMQEQAPEQVMQNTHPASKQEPKKEKKHTMRNN